MRSGGGVMLGGKGLGAAAPCHGLAQPLNPKLDRGNLYRRLSYEYQRPYQETMGGGSEALSSLSFKHQEFFKASTFASSFEVEEVKTKSAPSHLKKQETI